MLKWFNLFPDRIVNVIVIAPRWLHASYIIARFNYRRQASLRAFSANAHPGVGPGANCAG